MHEALDEVGADVVEVKVNRLNVEALAQRVDKVIERVLSQIEVGHVQGFERLRLQDEVTKQDEALLVVVHSCATQVKVFDGVVADQGLDDLLHGARVDLFVSTDVQLA